MATRHYYKFILLVFTINCITINIQSYPICPASVSSQSALKTIVDTTCVPQSSPCSQKTETFAVVCSPVSKSMYYLYRVFSSDGAVIRKIDSFDVVQWISSTTVTPVIKSLAVDNQEEKVYIATDTGQTRVIVLNASDGTFFGNPEFSNLCGNYDYVRIHPLSNGSGFYIISIVSASGSTNKIYKYLFSDPTNTQMQLISSITRYGYGQILVSDTDKITFGSNNADWGSTFLCSNQPCTLNPSESLLNADNSKLYAIAAYGNPTYLHIFVLKVSDGSKADAWYKSNTPNIEKVCGSALSGNYIAASIKIVTTITTTYNLMLWNTSSGEFTFKNFVGQTLNVLAVELSSGRYVVFDERVST